MMFGIELGPKLYVFVLVAVLVAFRGYFYWKKRRDTAPAKVKAEKKAGEKTGIGISKLLSRFNAWLNNFSRGVFFYMILAYVVFLIEFELYPWINLWTDPSWTDPKPFALFTLCYIVGTSMWKFYRNGMVPTAVTIILIWTVYSHHVKPSEQPADSGQAQAAVIQQVNGTAEIKSKTLKGVIPLHGTDGFNASVIKVERKKEYTKLKVKWEGLPERPRFVGVHWTTFLKDDQGNYYPVQLTKGIALGTPKKVYYKLPVTATLEFQVLPAGVKSFTLHLFGVEKDWSPKEEPLKARINI